MEAGAMPRRMMEGRLFIGRRKGRPRLRLLYSTVHFDVIKLHGTVQQ